MMATTMCATGGMGQGGLAARIEIGWGFDDHTMGVASESEVREIVLSAGGCRSDPQCKDQQHQHGQARRGAQAGKHGAGSNRSHPGMIHNALGVMKFHRQ